MVVMSKYGMRFLNMVIKIRFDRSEHSSIPLAYGAFHFLQMNGIETMEKGHVLKNIDWLQLLCSFSAMEMLHVSGGLEKHITSALEDTPKEMVAQVLPVLQLLWLESLDYIQDNKKGKGKPEPVSVDQFLSLRKKSGHPVVVVKSHNEFIGRLNPYQSELIRLSESIRNIYARGCDVVLV